MEIDDIETIAVLGACNMCYRIAEVAALLWYSLNLRAITQESVLHGY